MDQLLYVVSSYQSGLLSTKMLLFKEAQECALSPKCSIGTAGDSAVEHFVS